MMLQTYFLQYWRDQGPMLPIEAAYERWRAGQITRAEYERDFVRPEEARREAMRTLSKAEGRSLSSASGQEGGE